MARTQLVPKPVNRFGMTAQGSGLAGDTVNGMYFFNDGATFIRATSSSGADQTISILVPAGYDTNLTAGPRQLTVLANSTGSLSGFFPMDLYGSEVLFSVSSALVSLWAFSFLG